MPGYNADCEGTPLVELPKDAVRELGLISADNTRLGAKKNTVPVTVWAAPDGYGEEDCPYAGAGLYMKGKGAISTRWLNTVEEVISTP